MQDEAEVSAYTLPEYRNKGYFHLLFQKAGDELKKYGIRKVLFVHEPAGEAASHILKSFGASPAYSEYLLAYEPGSYKKISGRLRLEPAAQNNLPEMAVLDSQLFGDDYEESLSLLKKSLESGHIEVFCAFLGDKMIGLCNANTEGGNASVYGIGISPEFQGNGYGREMLNLLLEQLTKSAAKEITLEVSSTNTAAYRLYITNGFKVRTQYDYYPYIIN